MNTFADYEGLALSTAVYPGQGGPLGLMYVSLKGAGEAGEFTGQMLNDRVEELPKEVGDELWYVAAKARELGTTLADVVGAETFAGYETKLFDGYLPALNVEYLAHRGNVLAGEFAEQVGKAIRDDGMGAVEFGPDGPRELGPSPQRTEALKALLEEHVEHLACKARALNTSLAVIAAANIAKLLDRKDRGVLGGSGDNR